MYGRYLATYRQRSDKTRLDRSVQAENLKYTKPI